MCTCHKPCLRTRARNAEHQAKNAPECLPPTPLNNCNSETDKDRRVVSLAATSFSTSSPHSVEKGQEGGGGRGQELQKNRRASDLATQRECHRLFQIQPSASRDGKSPLKTPHLDLPNMLNVLHKHAWIAEMVYRRV
ncbi:hypothetical protein ElyMa_000412600 [Elysia marginata]|uniref:Uncharacterized protein n=1 Tax=Elysia marginata TaxID=1093978 RepID=A0AAV4FLB5_9GAST|nr:hypothetical protein ElyMa_000412600 [Elysia marginata]